MEINKHPRRPTNPRVTSTSETNGRDETDLLIADELEIQCVAQRSAIATSKAARDLVDEQIELIPILPIDEENARRFPVETTLLSTTPLRVVPAKQRSTPPVLEELHRSTPVTARPQRRFRLARVGALAVIAGFAIGWVAGRPPSQAVSSIGADAVLPSPAGESPLGTSGLERAGEKPAPSSAPRPVSDKSASPAEPVNEAAAVRAALAKYASAYTDLDAAAVSAIWPSVDQAGLSKAFSALDAQQVTFDRCDIQITGAAGRATCAGTAMWRPKIGGGSAREQNRTWNFVLKNAGGSWQIVKAEAR